MLSKEELKRVLISQREAILKKPTGIEREVLSSVEKKIKLPHILVITGIRRSGKSTLLRQIIKRFYNDEDFYYINFEDERLLDFDAKDFDKVYETLIELFGEQKTFFLDEIQNVNRFETFVRRFYDSGFKFYITGSSARLLSRELGTKLTGRHLDITVKPFSFHEFLKLRGFEFEENMVYITENSARIKSYFDEYLIKGGMPEYLIYDDLEILTRIYEDIVVKDIVVRYGIDNIAQLRELYQYLVTNVSNRFSFNSLKKLIGLGSVNTIKSYISYLEETYFAKAISKFDYSLKKQIINNKKIYVLDNGFIQTVSAKLTKDFGIILENLVFNSLDNSHEIFYYSNKRECDFILVKNRNINSIIQVAWELNNENKEREIEGITAAMKKFHLKTGIILTYDQEDELKIKSKRIIVKPVWKWLVLG